MNIGTPLNELTPLTAVDTETTGLHYRRYDRPFMVTFCDEQGQTACYYWEVDPFTRKPKYNTKEFDILGEYFSDTNRTSVFWNAKFDISMLEVIGLPLLGGWEEAMYGMHCVNSAEPKFGLKPISDKYADFPDEDLKTLLAAVKKQRKIGKAKGWKIGDVVKEDFWMCLDQCVTYGSNDAVRTMTMWLAIRDWMTEEDVWDAYEFEKRLVPVVIDMERRGAAVNVKAVKRSIRKYNAKRIISHRKLNVLAPSIDNFNSPKQLREFIYGVEQDDGKFKGGLGVPVGKTTKTGLPSTDAEALEKIEHPFVKELFRYQSACAANSNFFNTYLRFGMPESGIDENEYLILHPTINPLGARTGRFSMQKPALQQVPNDATSSAVEPIQARTPFSPRPGYIWLAADYKQIEARIFADVAQEENMLTAIRAGKDLHSNNTNKVWGGYNNPLSIQASERALELNDTASEGETRELVLEAWGKFGYKPDTSYDPAIFAGDWIESFDYDIVEAEASLHKEVHRGLAKNLIFLKIYGGGAGAVQSLVKCSMDEAYRIMNDFDSAFPRIYDYSQEVIELAREHGYIRTRYGKKLAVDKGYEYRAVNYETQGTAADFLKDRMMKSAQLLPELNRRCMDISLLLTVHDELIYEMKDRPLPLMLPSIRKLVRVLEDHEGKFSVPMTLDVDIMKGSWMNKEKLKL